MVWFSRRPRHTGYTLQRRLAGAKLAGKERRSRSAISGDDAIEPFLLKGLEVADNSTSL